MRRVEMTDQIWGHLLQTRNSSASRLSIERSAAAMLYGPLAEARGPFVLAQVGQSLDGRVATPFGDARDISGPDGLAHLHRCRALMDAVLVGVGTVKADNPRLSVREVRGPDPVRVVIDCRAELTGSERILLDDGAPVIVIQSAEAPRRALRADVIRLPLKERGLCPHDILNVLQDRGLNKILVEGGARTIARFLEQDLIDHLHVSIAPLIIGSGPSGISLNPIKFLSEAQRPQASVYSLGSDILFDCRLRAEAASSSARQGKDVQMANPTARALADPV